MPTNIDSSVLFQPLTIGNLSLKNRVVMAPMTRTAAPEGIPGDANANYYKRRAEGGIGLILSEGTVIDRPASRNEAGIPFFHGDKALSGWKSVIDDVHKAGGKMGPQLWHVGSTKGQGEWVPEAEVESPSGLITTDTPRGVAMTESDIADTISAFADAAVNAKNLGFDMIELHAAHGYLIDQFFWNKTNRRNDQWGGKTLNERTRFATEIIKAVRQAVGADFPIFMRLSQWKMQDYTVKLAENVTELENWLTPLSEAGVDVFHCSQRRFWEPEFADVDGENGLNFAGWAKKITGKITVSVGSVGLNNDFFGAFSGERSNHSSLEKLVERMERKEFDLIAVGRALITDPHWLEKIQNGSDSELKGFSPEDLTKLI